MNFKEEEDLEMKIDARELKEGYNEIVPCGEMKFIEFGVLKLSKGKEFEIFEENKETACILLTGQVMFEVDGKSYKTGIRKDLFNTNAWALYLPKGAKVRVEALADSEIAVAKAPSTKEGKTVFITPDMVKVKSVGEWNWRRDVKDIIDASIPSEHFVIGETVNPPCNWSSWPPHKHDINDYPNEIDMEEVYYFKVNPPTGFGIQRIYDTDFNEVYVVEDGDTVLIKRGYHPVAAAPGHQVYYLWILGGEERILLPNDDPKFKWQKHIEPLVKEIKRG